MNDLTARCGCTGPCGRWPPFARVQRAARWARKTRS